MTCCLPADLDARLPAGQLALLADDDGDGQADPAVLEAAIADAAAEIDARLAPRYCVPFAAPPAAVVAVCAALALDRLFARRRETPPEAFARAVADARKLLDDLAEGRAALGPGAAGRPRPESLTRGIPPLFPPERPGHP